MTPSWWVADLFHANPAMLVAWVFWVIFSITLHELGHGWAAIRAGDRTPIETGHMTWNPIVHMGPMSLILFALVGIAWGMMPVNPSRLRGFGGHARAVVAAAGPAINIGLAIVCAVGAALWLAYATTTPMSDSAWRFGRDFLETGAFLNVALAMLNLLPVPPLDGSRILAHFSPAYERFASHPALGMAALILVLLFGGRYLFPIARDSIDHTVAALVRAAPGAAPPEARFERALSALTPEERDIVERVRKESLEGVLERMEPAPATP